MNSALKLAALTLASVTVFCGSFVLFAALSGAPMHEIALIGDWFEAPGPAQDADPLPTDLTSQLEADQRPTRQVVAEATSPLAAFLVPSPFTTEQLESLQGELKLRLEATRELQQELRDREQELALREEHLEERWQEMERIRNSLLEQDLDLEQRKDELDRDARAQAERERASWQSMAKVFSDGKPKDLVQDLVLFAPDEAARILRALPEERASELIRELPRDRYLEYAEAYRKAAL